MLAETHCPLCMAPDAKLYFEDVRRPYHRCGHCALVYVPPRWFIDRNAEHAEYLKHENDVHDPAYRRFLSRLADPLTSRLKQGACGLDFGCGPGPALALMLREQGFSVCVYDPFFAADPSVLNGAYDFITATEVVEHMHRPGAELDKLWNLLKPGGLFAVMTKLVIDQEAFGRWHYKNDPTHVSFFSRETFVWWAAQQGAETEFFGEDVIFLRRAT